jgi:hypothetical protein
MNDADKAKQAVSLLSELLLIYREAIRDATREDTLLHGIPSGHLYAATSRVISLEMHQQIVKSMVDAGLVRESNHLLTWIGD